MSNQCEHIAQMARSVRGQPHWKWPAWSTGDQLIVALVLNDAGALAALSYTILEALDRVDLSLSTAELRRIEREVQSS
jgi:hypothetical protein